VQAYKGIAEPKGRGVIAPVIIHAVTDVLLTLSQKADPIVFYFWNHIFHDIGVLL
jgi:hypothetical protein